MIGLVSIPPPKRNAFTLEDRNALLKAITTHQWTTAREAYGWAWNHLGVRCSYLTVWRFLTSHGLLVGDTPRARRLCTTV